MLKNSFIKNLLEFKENDCFNELSFIIDCLSNYNIKTLTFCTLYSIKRSDFIALLESKFKEDLVINSFL